MTAYDDVIETLGNGGDVVVTAVNANPRYLWMAPYWLRFWQLLARDASYPITPIIIAVDLPAHRVNIPLHKSMIWLDSGGSHSSALASQLVRIIWPGSLPDLPGNVVTSDVDMLPLSLRAFDCARRHAQARDCFVVVRNVLEADQQFPICYNVAPPSLWRDIFQSSGSVEADLARALEQCRSYEDTHGGVGWFSDQQLLYSRVSSWEERGGAVVRLQDEDFGHRRLDRTSSLARTFLTGPFVTSGRWTDFHAYPPSRASAALNDWLTFWLARRRNESNDS